MKVKMITYVLFSVMLASSLGCKKAMHVEPPVKGDLKINLLGNMVPQTFDIEKGMFAVIQFRGSDLKYRFDLNRIDANYYVGLLAAAQKTSGTIKVYVTKQTEIVRLEK